MHIFSTVSIAYFSVNLQYYKRTGGNTMVFQLKPDRKETENKTIRFPLSVIERIDEVIVNQDVTFSSFVIQACEYALENMDTDGPTSTDETKN